MENTRAVDGTRAARLSQNKEVVKPPFKEARQPTFRFQRGRTLRSPVYVQGR